MCLSSINPFKILGYRYSRKVNPCESLDTFLKKNKDIDTFLKKNNIVLCKAQIRTQLYSIADEYLNDCLDNINQLFANFNYPLNELEKSHIIAVVKHFAAEPGFSEKISESVEIFKIKETLNWYKDIVNTFGNELFLQTFSLIVIIINLNEPNAKNLSDKNKKMFFKAVYNKVSKCTSFENITTIRIFAKSYTQFLLNNESEAETKNLICPISFESIPELLTTNDNKISLSPYSSNLYKSNLVQDWVKSNGTDPTTRAKLKEEDLFDVTEDMREFYKISIKRV